MQRFSEPHHARGLEPTMSPTLLDSPPPRAPASPPSAKRTRETGPALAPRRQARRSSAFPVALGISALLHLLALLIFRFDLPDLYPLPSPPGEDAVERPSGMRVYDIVAVDAPAVIPREEQPAQTQQGAVAPRPPQETSEEQPRPPEDPAARPGRPSIAERLAPRLTDAELWAAVPLPEELEAHRDEVVLRRLEDRLAAYNDSMAAAAAAAGRAVDWTVKDKNGGRWGVSPEGIHLGGVTLPVPIQFSTPAGRRDAVNGAIRNWSDIQTQRGQAEVRAGIEDRVKAIRERKEAERRDSTKSSGSN